MYLISYSKQSWEVKINRLKNLAVIQREGGCEESGVGEKILLLLLLLLNSVSISKNQPTYRERSRIIRDKVISSVAG